MTALIAFLFELFHFGESPACISCIGWEYSYFQEIIKARWLFLCNVWKCL